MRTEAIWLLKKLYFIVYQNLFKNTEIFINLWFLRRKSFVLHIYVYAIIINEIFDHIF